MKNYNQNIAANNIINHGCHCSKYSDNEFTGGPAVDIMDRMCQDWNAKLKCLGLPGGACENGIDFNFFSVQMYKNGTFSDDEEFACEKAVDGCEAAFCKVTYDWGVGLWNSADEGLAGSNMFDYVPNAECFPQPPTGGEQICVGDAPDVDIINY